MKQLTYDQFGKHIKAQRTRMGLSQQKLASKIDISRNYLSMIERGLAQGLSYDIVYRLSTILGLEPIVTSKKEVNVYRLGTLTSWAIHGLTHAIGEAAIREGMLLTDEGELVMSWGDECKSLLAITSAACLHFLTMEET